MKQADVALEKVEAENLNGNQAKHNTAVYMKAIDRVKFGPESACHVVCIACSLKHPVAMMHHSQQTMYWRAKLG